MFESWPLGHWEAENRFLHGCRTLIVVYFYITGGLLSPNLDRSTFISCFTMDFVSKDYLRTLSLGEGLFLDVSSSFQSESFESLECHWAVYLFYLSQTKLLFESLFVYYFFCCRLLLSDLSEFLYSCFLWTFVFNMLTNYLARHWSFFFSPEDISVRLDSKADRLSLSSWLFTLCVLISDFNGSPFYSSSLQSECSIASFLTDVINLLAISSRSMSSQLWWFLLDLTYSCVSYNVRVALWPSQSISKIWEFVSKSSSP